MFKYTTTTQKKIETIFKEAGYIVRYEKGNFNSGYCLLEEKKVVVVNKFFSLEAKINSLAEILLQIEVDEEKLDESTRKFFQTVLKSKQEDL